MSDRIWATQINVSSNMTDNAQQQAVDQIVTELVSGKCCQVMGKRKSGKSAIMNKALNKVLDTMTTFEGGPVVQYVGLTALRFQKYIGCSADILFIQETNYILPDEDIDEYVKLQFGPKTLWVCESTPYFHEPQKLEKWYT